MAHNCGESPTEGAVLTHVEAQQRLVDIIKKLSLGIVCYWCDNVEANCCFENN